MIEKVLGVKYQPDQETEKMLGTIVITPKVFKDDRGYFFQSWNERDYRQLGISTHWIQDNESKSCYGVLRGLHYQVGPYVQAKLVRVINGTVLDVAVDIRKNSPTFGQHFSVILSDENKRQFYIPRGFAHGFVVLSKEVTFAYKVDNEWNKASERGIMWNYPYLNIDWQINEDDVILSDKDKQNFSFNEAEYL